MIQMIIGLVLGNSVMGLHMCWGRKSLIGDNTHSTCREWNLDAGYKNSYYWVYDL